MFRYISLMAVRRVTPQMGLGVGAPSDRGSLCLRLGGPLCPPQGKSLGLLRNRVGALSKHRPPIPPKTPAKQPDWIGNQQPPLGGGRDFPKTTKEVFLFTLTTLK